MSPAFARLCYITDRSALGDRPLARLIWEARQAGVDLIQIREKDPDTASLLALVQTALEGDRAADGRRSGSRIVVNDRLDVAVAAGAHGVHLGNHSMPVREVRRSLRAIGREDFRIGVSCHAPHEVAAAEALGADYVLLGPIFETPSKARYGPPLGVGAIEEAARCVHMPILALGGITLDRVRACLNAGATGIAGISIFQNCPSIKKRVEELRLEMERR